jgi:hypothetical protein
VRWRVRRSKASGRSGAQELTDRCTKERGEWGTYLEPHWSSAVVSRLGDDDEVVAAMELGDGGARAWREAGGGGGLRGEVR